MSHRAVFPARRALIVLGLCAVTVSLPLDTLRAGVIYREDFSVASLPAHRTTTWRPLDASGRDLPSGVYWIFAPGVEAGRLVRTR